MLSTTHIEMALSLYQNGGPLPTVYSSIYNSYRDGTFSSRMEASLYCIQLYVQLMERGRSFYQNGGPLPSVHKYIQLYTTLHGDGTFSSRMEASLFGAQLHVQLMERGHTLYQNASPLPTVYSCYIQVM